MVKADFGEPFPLFAPRNPPRGQTLPNPTGPKCASAALIVKIDDDDNDEVENNADSDIGQISSNVDIDIDSN